MATGTTVAEERLHDEGSREAVGPGLGAEELEEGSSFAVNSSLRV